MSNNRYSQVINQLAKAGLRSPKALTLSITNGCNLFCGHCWPDSHPHKITPPVPEKILKKLIREFAGLGGESLIITGGEPMTHPAWFEIASFSCQVPGIRSVCLQTNATLFTEAEVSALGSVDFGNLSIQVSLDGATAKSHDRIRGSGSFDRTMRGLRLLAGSNLRDRTVVAFTELRHNFIEIPQLFEIMDYYLFHRVVTSTLVQVGRAADADGLAPPIPSQYRDLLTRYHLDACFRERYERMGSIAAIEWYKGKKIPSRLGCVLIEKPYVTADGRMYPCVMFQADEFAGRGFHEQPFEDALAEMIPLWAGLQKKSQERMFKVRKCALCPGRLHCAGGCMGRAYLANRDVLSAEDRCSLRKAVYAWEA
jgi:radical SAM protein with 4Fe4S-binding SPASM domain